MEYSFIMWKDLLPEKTSYLCSGCKTCDGTVCINQLPGWGGINSNRNFILNYSSWEEIQIPEQDIVNAGLPEIALAPMTGMVQNAGLKDEKQGYFTLVESAANAGIKLSVGDGEPDYKLEYGIEALKTLGKKAAVFIKPYENHELKKRIGKSLSIAECIGIDIDAWEIKTMKNSSSMPAAMEKKNLSKLKEIKSFLPPEIPFVIKGVADQETLNMILELKPFAAVVSNHGGRVSAPEKGTAYILSDFAGNLLEAGIQVWVDGGLRTKEHLLKASALGASKVLIGRPFLQGAICLGKEGIKTVLNQDFGFSIPETVIQKRNLLSVQRAWSPQPVQHFQTDIPVSGIGTQCQNRQCRRLKRRIQRRLRKRL